MNTKIDKSELMISYKGAFIHVRPSRKTYLVQLGAIIKGPFPSVDRAKWFVRQCIKDGWFVPPSDA